MHEVLVVEPGIRYINHISPALAKATNFALELIDFNYESLSGVVGLIIMVVL